MVDLKARGIVVEILLDFFYKWMSFNEEVNEIDKEEARKILKSSKEIEYGPLAREYIENLEIRKKFDELKKQVGYNY